MSVFSAWDSSDCIGPCRRRRTSNIWTIFFSLCGKIYFWNKNFLDFCLAAPSPFQTRAKNTESLDRNKCQVSLSLHYVCDATHRCKRRPRPFPSYAYNQLTRPRVRRREGRKGQTSSSSSLLPTLLHGRAGITIKRCINADKKMGRRSVSFPPLYFFFSFPFFLFSSGESGERDCPHIRASVCL